MNTTKIFSLLLTATVLISGCATPTKERQLQKFIKSHERKVKPLEKKTSLAYWKAANTGDPKDYDKVSKLTLKILKIYSNRRHFAMLSDIKDSGEIKDPLLARQ